MREDGQETPENGLENDSGGQDGEVEVIVARPRGGRKPALGPHDLERIEELAAGGLSKYEIAESLGISRQTLHEYCRANPDYTDAITRGKEKSIPKVENSMHKLARGYTVQEEDIRVIGKKVVRIPILKHYPPNERAQHLILQHAETGSWRQRQDVELHFPEPLILKDQAGKPLESLGAQEAK